MELKIGYKQTEVGITPFDWEVKSFGEICSPSKARINPLSTIEEIKCIELEHLSQETGRLLGYADLKDLKSQKSIFKKGDVLFGKLRPYLKKYLFAEFDGVCTTEIWVLKPISRIQSKWLFYLVQSKQIQEAANQAIGTKMPRAEWKTVSDSFISFPPTKAEQTAIATALSDADALITSLEKLIEKKRAIKQGAMQQLLTPEKDWVEKSILQIADNKKELFDDGDWIESEHITNEGIRLLQTGNIGIGKFVDKEEKKYIYAHSFEKLNCKEIIEGDLLICRLAEPAGRACVLPNIGEEKIITSVDVTIFRPRSEVVNRIFLSYLFSTGKWLNAVSEQCGGTTHKRISRGALGKINVIVPPSIEEQTAIAKILSDMDGEIIALEQKQSKYKMIKQGMMQELLTGKIRLV